ncbi:MAG TPA: hypothetical protein VF062_01565, partial [Candidatus Limnocylindrales bacterium]
NPEAADTDGDDQSDAAEASLGTDPLRSDSDADGISDGVEVQFGSDPLNPASTIGPAAATGGLGSDLGQGVGQPAGPVLPTGAPADNPLGIPAAGSAEPLDFG